MNDWTNVNGDMDAGYHEVTFDGSGNRVDDSS